MSEVVLPLVDRPLQPRMPTETNPLPSGNKVDSETAVDHSEANIPECSEKKFRIFSIDTDAVFSTYSPNNVIVQRPKVVRNTKIFSIRADCATSNFNENVAHHQHKAAEKITIPDTKIFSIQTDSVLSTTPSATQNLLQRLQAVENATPPKRAKLSTRFSTDNSTVFCSSQNIPLHQPDTARNSIIPESIRNAIFSAANIIPSVTSYGAQNVTIHAPKVVENGTILELNSNAKKILPDDRDLLRSTQRLTVHQPESTEDSIGHKPVVIPKIYSIADYVSSTTSYSTQSKLVNGSESNENTKIYSIKSDAVLPPPLPVEEIPLPPPKPVDGGIDSNLSDTASCQVMKKDLVPTIRKLKSLAILKLRKNKQIMPRSKAIDSSMPSDLSNKALGFVKKKNYHLAKSSKVVPRSKTVGRSNTSNLANTVSHRFVKKISGKGKNKSGAIRKLSQNTKVMPRFKAVDRSSTSNLSNTASHRFTKKAFRKRKNNVATPNLLDNTKISPPPETINHTNSATQCSAEDTPRPKINNVATPNSPQNTKTVPLPETINHTNSATQCSAEDTPRPKINNVATPNSPQNTKTVPQSNAVDHTNTSVLPNSASHSSSTSAETKINSIATPNLQHNTKTVPSSKAVNHTSVLPDSASHSFAKDTSTTTKINSVAPSKKQQNIKTVPPSKNRSINSNSSVSHRIARKGSRKDDTNSVGILDLLKNTIVPQSRAVSCKVVTPNSYNTASHRFGNKRLVSTTRKMVKVGNSSFKKVFNSKKNSASDICTHEECMNNRLKKINFVKATKIKIKKNKKNIHNIRKWEKLYHGKPRSGFEFSVMSYNVLAQDLIYQHAYLYQNHDQEALSWNVRWQNLLQEIKNTDPDIMCLQEVQEAHIQDYFSLLTTLGYEGIYKKRTGIRVDGCAIYYKKDKVTALEHTTVEYRQPDVPLLDRDNVGLVVKFAPKHNPTREFVVATTHLLYNPRREDVRLAQTQLLLTEVERISYKPNARRIGNFYLPVIITGDFNALPDSNLIKFIVNGKINYNELAPQLLDQKPNGPVLVTTTLGISDKCQHVDLLTNRKRNITISRSEEQKLIKLCSSEVEKAQCSATQARQLLSSGTLSHTFTLKSVYDNQKGTTNQNGEWIVVDYIFYSAFRGSKNGTLIPMSRYGLPKRRTVRHITIPNKDVGSDHFSLLVRFQLSA